MSSSNTTGTTNAALSRKSKEMSAFGCGCFGVLFFGVFLLIGSINFYMMFLQPYQNYLAVQSWVETPCTIQVSNTRPVGSSYEMNVTYTYLYAGDQYESSQFRHPTNSGGKLVDDAQTADRYQVGAQLNCYVDPTDPDQAVLDRSFPYDILFGLIALIFVIVGLVGIVVSVLFSRTQKGREDTTESSENVFAERIATQLGATSGLQVETGSERQVGKWTVVDHGASAWLPEFESGPQELKPSSRPWQMFAGLLVFGLIWNGVISVLVLEVFNDWANGKQPWFFTLFATPFVLIGVGILLGACYYFLAMFNPRPEVYVSSAAVPLGDSLRVKWVLIGRVSKIREFSIKLTGVEEAVYQQGTDTRTDTHTFYETTAYTTQDSFEIESGDVRIDLPSDSMHTIKARRNRIVWKIEMRGDVPFWPDVSQSYEITVLPQLAEMPATTEN